MQYTICYYSIARPPWGGGGMPEPPLYEALLNHKSVQINSPSTSELQLTGNSVGSVCTWYTYSPSGQLPALTLI